MKDRNVVITDNTICMEDNPNSIVMDIGSKSLMEIYSHIVCQNGGDVLDVGFGMGFSADIMSKLSNTYTCIECNPQIYENAKKWAKTKSNVEIIFGDWVDVIPQLNKKFDGIFMDTHEDPNYSKFEEYAKLISKENTILSIFNYFWLRDRKELNEYICNMGFLDFKKPTSPVHYVNWTEYENGEFKKTNNNFKSKKNYII